MKASIDLGATAMPRASTRPISWPICVTVFFVGSVILWADRTNFSVAAAVWAKDYGWQPSTIGMMLSAFSLGYLVHAAGRRLDRRPRRPAPHARRRHGGLVAVGAADADRAHRCCG